MTPKEFKSLSRGDIVRGRFSMFGMLVIEKQEDCAVVMHTTLLTNPKEWELVAKADYNKKKRRP